MEIDSSSPNIRAFKRWGYRVAAVGSGILVVGAMAKSQFDTQKYQRQGEMEQRILNREATPDKPLDLRQSFTHDEDSFNHRLQAYNDGIARLIEGSEMATMTVSTTEPDHILVK